MKGTIKTSLFLFVTAVVVVTLLGVSYSLTLEPKEYKFAQIRNTVMREVFPQADDFMEVRQAEDEPEGYPEGIVAVYECMVGGQPAGYVVELAKEGYSGKIGVMVGISSAEGLVTGMRVLSHTETPGLGALATREQFYRKFDGRPLTPITVVRSGPGENEIDAITSATITTSAITGAVNAAIDWYNQRPNR